MLKSVLSIAAVSIAFGFTSIASASVEAELKGALGNTDDTPPPPATVQDCQAKERPDWYRDHRRTWQAQRSPAS